MYVYVLCNDFNSFTCLDSNRQFLKFSFNFELMIHSSIDQCRVLRKVDWIGPFSVFGGP